MIIRNHVYIIIYYIYTILYISEFNMNVNVNPMKITLKSVKMV